MVQLRIAVSSRIGEFIHLEHGDFDSVITESDLTMITNAGPSRFLSRIGLLVIASLMVAVTSADCVLEMHGEVYCGAGRCIFDRKGTIWCSRYYDGDAEITSDGQVLCGKGQCAKDRDGQILCSSEVGGAVLIDTRGRVHCYGRCEPATADKCENTRADS